MRNKILVSVLALVMLFGIGMGSRAEAYTAVSVNVFFDALAPHGNWISSPDYGYAWQPHRIGTNWRPYSYGHWSWSDYGWIWVSDEPWGWATYHYGRWVFDDYYGWIWLPGTEWAPAWVTWFNGPGYIGWAPLAPDYDFFRSDYGYYGDYVYRYKYGHHHYYKPSHCIFVPSEHFLHRRIHSVAVNPARNVTIIKNTKNVTNIKLVNNKLVNYGPDISVVEKNTRQKVRRINVTERDLTVIKRGAKVNQFEGQEYRVYRPRIIKEKKKPSFVEKNSRNNAGKVEKRDRYVAPKYERSNERKHNIRGDHEFKEPRDLKYRIGPADRNRSVETRKSVEQRQKEPKFEYRRKEPVERGYSKNSDRKKRNAFGAENRGFVDKVETRFERKYTAPKREVVKTRKKVNRAGGVSRSSYSSAEKRSIGKRDNNTYKGTHKRASRTNIRNERQVRDLKYQPNERSYGNKTRVGKGTRGNNRGTRR